MHNITYYCQYVVLYIFKIKRFLPRQLLAVRNLTPHQSPSISNIAL
nr:MAG TPA: hypothetical protein [Caudoviricetes sp.]